MNETHQMFTQSGYQDKHNCEIEKLDKESQWKLSIQR